MQPRKCELRANPELKRKVDVDADRIRENFPKGLARPALRALHAAGFTDLRQLVTATEQEIAALHGMGPKALALLRDALEARSLHFKP